MARYRDLLPAFFLILLAIVTAKPVRAQQAATYCSGWKAFHNSQPIAKPMLHVSGECNFPTPGYSAKLQPAEPQGINPTIYILNLIITKPTGTVPQHPVQTPITYSEQTKEKYTSIQIMPDGISVPVKEVSASAASNKSPCSGWKAWHDSQPGKNPTLYVEGECTFTTGGYSVELKPAPTHGGVYYKSRILDLIIHEPTGIVTQVITNVPVNYSEETPKKYTNVKIMPDGVLVPVKEVSAPEGK
jgi:hypothetical protein